MIRIYIEKCGYDKKYIGYEVDKEAENMLQFGVKVIGGKRHVNQTRK